MKKLPHQVIKILGSFSKLMGSLFHFEDKDRTITIRLQNRLYIIVWVLLFITYALSPIDITVIGFSSITVLILISFFWARTTAQGISCNRKLKYTALQVGDWLEEEVYLENTSFLPLVWAEFIDHSDIPEYTISSVRVADAQSSNKWNIQTVCKRRGLYKLGPWELITSDPFGLFKIQLTYKKSQEILVYPPLTRISNEFLPYRNSVGEFNRLRQQLTHETINAISARKYAPGDPLRRVHWPTTAKKMELHVKVFEPEASSIIWLVPDFDSSVQVGAGNKSSCEAIVMLLASFCRFLLQSRHAVGLFFHTDEQYVVAPQYGESHFWPLLRVIAPVQPAANQSLSSTLQELQSIASPGDSILVFTPSLNPTWPKILSQGKLQPNAKVLLFDPKSFGGNTSAANFLPLLGHENIPFRVVYQEEITPIHGALGAVRRWEFKSFGTGKVFIKQSPREVD